MITYLFTFVFSLLIIWSLKYFTNEIHHAKINKLISLTVILAALLLNPTILSIWSSGIEVLTEQAFLSLVIFSLSFGGLIGSHLPHHTKEIKTFTHNQTKKPYQLRELYRKRYGFSLLKIKTQR